MNTLKLFQEIFIANYLSLYSSSGNSVTTQELFSSVLKMPGFNIVHKQGSCSAGATQNQSAAYWGFPVASICLSPTSDTVDSHRD